MNRRAFILGIAMVAVATEANARAHGCCGYVTRRQRREREAADAAAEQERRNLLTPEQRAAEDAAMARNQAAAASLAFQRNLERERSRRDEEAERERRWKTTRSLLFTVFGILGVGGVCIAGIIGLSSEGGSDAR